MSLKATLVEAFADDPRVSTIIVQDGKMHGELGRFVKIFGHAIWIEIFLADNRKIQDEHALAIIKSYLHNINAKESK